MADLNGVGTILGLLSGGGVVGAFVDNHVRSKLSKKESLLEKRTDVYSATLSSVRCCPANKKEEHELKTDELINKALLLTANPRIKDLLHKIRDEISKGKYWSESTSRIGKGELSELEELMQRELGVKVSWLSKKMFLWSGKAFKKVRPNDFCPCNSGQKFKKCHGV